MSAKDARLSRIAKAHKALVRKPKQRRLPPMKR